MSEAKIYVLTQGSYSDYQILGVFTSRDKALEFCPALESGLNEDSGEKPVLEEWDLDPERPEEFMQETWHVYLNFDGQVSMESNYAEEHPRDYSSSGILHDRKVIGTSVVSRDHAMKLAVERRQQHLREQTATDAPPATP